MLFLGIVLPCKQKDSFEYLIRCRNDQYPIPINRNGRIYVDCPENGGTHPVVGD